MKNWNSIIFVALIAAMLVSCGDRKKVVGVFEYTNPISSGIDTNGLRDCHVLRDGDTWYMTGTVHPHWPRQETDGKLNPGVPLYKSNDLLNWEFVKFIVERPDSTKWYYRRFWAPEIQIIQGKYYALFNCSNPDAGFPGQHIGYAVADKIDGPYTVVTEEKPLANGNDLTFFEDTDGKVWAFWNRGREFGIGFAQIDLEKGMFLTEPTTAIQPEKVDYEYDSLGEIVNEPGYDGLEWTNPIRNGLNDYGNKDFHILFIEGNIFPNSH
jgi:xylan 1,4-beta-xylosidase